VEYEIRAMSFGEILDTGFRILRNHFVLLAGLEAIVFVPPRLATDILSRGSDLTDPFVLLSGMIPVFLALLILQPIIMAAITHAIGESYLSRSVTFGGALRFALSIVLPLLGTWILASLIVLVGFALLIIPGLILLLMFALLTPVMVTEKIFGFAAMERSWALMKGNMLRALGLLIVTGILSSALTAGVDLVAGFMPFIGSVVAGVVQGAANAFGAAALVVLYFDTRCRKEAFDLEHLAAQVESGAGAPRGGIV
jgi:sorbitol-specific phosphotransferase system component IIC